LGGRLLVAALLLVMLAVRAEELCGMEPPKTGSEDSCSFDPTAASKPKSDAMTFLVIMGSTRNAEPPWGEFCTAFTSRVVWYHILSTSCCCVAVTSWISLAAWCKFSFDDLYEYNYIGRVTV
jgi:hypothetical protein